MNTRQMPATASEVLPTPSLKNETEDWRKTFVRLLLIGAMILGLLTLAPAVLASRGLGQIALFVAFYLLLAVVVAVQTPYWLRVTCFLLLVYTLGTAQFVLAGTGGTATFFFLALIVFTTLLWSARAGAAATTIVLFTFGIFAAIVRTRNLGGIGVSATSSRPLDWIGMSATALLFGVAIIAALRQMRLASQAGEGSGGNRCAQLGRGR